MRNQLGPVAGRAGTWATALAWGRVGGHETTMPWQGQACMFPASFSRLLDSRRGLSTATGAGETSADTATKVGALRAWVTARFGSVHAGVQVAFSAEDGLGLEAGADLPAGTTLVALPKPAQLGAGAASRCQDLARLLAAVPDGLPTAKTALCLLRERVAPPAEAGFAPYLEMLPRSFATCPLFYSSDLVARMEYLPAIHQMNMRREWLQKFAAKELATPRAAFYGATVTADDLAWAWTVVTSRAFGLMPGAPHLLLPFVDFANHTPLTPAARVALSKASGEMRLLAARDVRRGEPICISYGELPNDDLLLGYGFVLEDNPYESVDLQFNLGLIAAAQTALGLGAPTAAPNAGQDAALHALRLAGPGADPRVRVRRELASQGFVEPRLLAGVRALCASPGLQCSLRALGSWAEAVDSGTEERAMLMLMAMHTMALDTFANRDPSMDTAELATMPDQNSAQAMVVRMRRSKKQLLTDALHACVRRIEEVRKH